MNILKLLRALKEGQFELSAEGLLVPSQRILAKGQFCVSKRGEPDEFSDNLVVTEGLDYILGSALRGVTAIPSWFIGIYSGSVTVGASWTGVNFASNSTELTAYDSATRPAWSPTAAASGVISSYSSKAEFVASSAITVRGAGLLSSSVKGGNTGTLIAASNFSTAKSLADDEILDVGYQLTLTPV